MTQLTVTTQVHSLSPMVEIDARFQIDNSEEEEEELNKDGEGGLEMYLTLDEEIQSKARNGEEEKAIKSPIQYCPPLPPKVCENSCLDYFNSISLVGSSVNAHTIRHWVCYTNTATIYMYSSTFMDSFKFSM